MTANAENADSADLEALFDTIASAMPLAKLQTAAAPAAPAANEAGAEFDNDRVIRQIGQMTRTLHDALRELGYDKLVQDTAERIPDVRERLSYISTMTERSAGRVLNATEAAGPIQERLGAAAGKLGADWDRLFANQLSVDEFKTLAEATRKLLLDVPQQTAATSAHLHEIMMAQDFQDLTGQVIKKITELAQDMESKLIAVLLEVAPRERSPEAASGLLNGPAMNPHLRNDVAVSQNQVDELLESLGF
jgi:chemotaxis protein CheZ